MAPQVTPHDDDSTTYEPLLDPESSVMVFLSEPAVSTVSFFTGDVDLEKSRAWLKERLGRICKANPWLAGRLVKKRKSYHKNVCLSMPSTIAEEDVDALIVSGADDALDALSTISTETPYEVICEKLLKSKAVVGRGYHLVGKDARVSKFTLAKVADGQVALVVSITHAVADGHTYYKIMGMLSGDVQSLSSTRRHDFVPKSIEAIGTKDHKYLSSFAFTLCCIKSMLCGSKAKLDARYVDEDKVKELKADTKSGWGYISTNDILTSTFSKATKADILLMAINLRKRVKEAGEMDAGNYSLVVLHDAESSASPEGVRASVGKGPPYTRKGEGGDTPLPGFFKTLGSQVAMITNWAFADFHADLSLCSSSGENDIPLELHLPIPYHPKEIAFPIGVVFRPRPGKIGILFGGSQSDVSLDRLIEAGAPLGDAISDNMFPA